MKISVLLFAILFSLSVSAKTILISDVDDTIKIAHINDLFGKIEQAFDLDMFWGMNSLYRYLSNEVVDGVYYVTNAPDWLMREKHREFLKAHKFPKGQVFFRSESAEVHKIQSIQQILIESKPKKVILIGDDAEDDIEIYNKIVTENSDIKFYTYIKTNYSQKRLINNQVAFATPIDILIHLNNNKVINHINYIEGKIYQLVSILDGQSPPLWDDDDLKIQIFPKWTNCQNWKLLSSNVISQKAQKKYQQKLTAHCSS